MPANPLNPSQIYSSKKTRFRSSNKAKQAAGIDGGLGSEQDAYFEMPDGSRQHVNELLTIAMNDAMALQKEGLARCVFKPEGRKLLIGGTEVPYLGIIIDFQIITESETRDFVSERIAELIVEGAGDADIVIFDDQIQRRRIDENTGQIL